MGEITPVDLFRAMPFGGAIFEIDIKGKVLRRVLDAGLENYGSGGYLQWHNIEYQKAGTTWKINGYPLLDDKTYHIASSDYLANGREERLEFFNEKNFVKLDKPVKGDTTDLREDVRRAVVNYMKSLKN
ncbi:MAG: 5'-nucleotidase [Saprospiraceae bacterium]